MKKIYFDMDGTVYDLYGLSDWLPRLRAEDASAYADGQPKVDMIELETICLQLKTKGFDIGIITWLAKDSTPDFSKRTEKVKRAWAKKYMPYITSFVAQEYGTPKSAAIENGIDTAILIDDNEDVRAEWENTNNYTINANMDILTALRELTR